jgi:hypothetical protein
VTLGVRFFLLGFNALTHFQGVFILLLPCIEGSLLLYYEIVIVPVMYDRGYSVGVPTVFILLDHTTLHLSLQFLLEEIFYYCFRTSMNPLLLLA